MSNRGGWTPDNGVQIQVGGRADDRSSIPTLIMTSGGIAAVIAQKAVGLLVDIGSFALPVKIMINGLTAAVPAFVAAALATAADHYNLENRKPIFGRRISKINQEQGQKQTSFESRQQSREHGRHQGRHQRPQGQSNRFQHKSFREVVPPPSKV